MAKLLGITRFWNYISDWIECRVHLRPEKDNTSDLGSSDYRWRRLYAALLPDHDHSGDSGDGAKIAGIAALSDLDADTYNDSAAKVLGSDTDGGLRLDHLELGNVTSATEGELRAAANVRASGFFYLGPVTTLTIASGVVTATGSYHAVDTEGGAASDDLDSINGGGNGAILILRSANSGRDVTLREGVGGNLALAGNFTLSTIEDRIMLIQHSNVWYEVCRSDNS